MFALPVPSVSPERIPADSLLLDIRENDEWEAGHAPDALHLPMMEIPARLAEIPRQQPVVVMCRSGGRSARVVAYLRDNGWDEVFNLSGGMAAWAAAGRPVVAASGQHGMVI